MAINLEHFSQDELGHTSHAICTLEHVIDGTVKFFHSHTAAFWVGCLNQMVAIGYWYLISELVTLI